MGWHLSWAHLTWIGWSSIKCYSSVATHELQELSDPARKHGESWQITEDNFCSVQTHIPLLPWKGVGHDTIPAIGRYIPLSPSISISSQMVALIIKTFIRSWPHPQNTKLLICKKRQWNTGVIYLLLKENKGLHKAGSSWGLASPGSCPARPFPRFLNGHTFCSWCSVRLQALPSLNTMCWAAFASRESDSHA